MMERTALLVLLLSSCQHSENRYAEREVDRTELFGSWTITEFGLKSLQDGGVRDNISRADHALELRADGSCSVKTTFGLPGSNYRVYDSGCTWRLGNIGHQTLELELTPPVSAYEKPYFYFAEENGQLILWQYATDPDAWRYLEFERAGS